MPEEITMAPAVLAELIHEFRAMRGWSQETLADLAHINVRTIQRVEAGRPAGVDTLRALARAFELQDIDFFRKPMLIPTAEEIEAEKARLDRDFVEIACESPASGRSIVAAVTGAHASHAHRFGDVPPEVDKAFADLLDYARDYIDCADCHSERQRVDDCQELDGYLAFIKEGLQ